MHVDKNDLKLDHLTILIPGKELFKLEEDVTVCGIENLRLSEMPPYWWTNISHFRETIFLFLKLQK